MRGASPSSQDPSCLTGGWQWGPPAAQNQSRGESAVAAHDAEGCDGNPWFTGRRPPVGSASSVARRRRGGAARNKAATATSLVPGKRRA
ncbi:hypothetical protein AAFF_G00000340 [Aldrovandia affinis]|uniref:Uncharacterized protein n=1 Tax=Aldrovandia affinis TaxID=143900 RepID=A0AAD7TCP3_9TELE|nr:hypothetical protein AAFF_G00000340 [Aldrovandia affinis]